MEIGGGKLKSLASHLDIVPFPLAGGPNMASRITARKEIKGNDGVKFLSQFGVKFD